MGAPTTDTLMLVTFLQKCAAISIDSFNWFFVTTVVQVRESTGGATEPSLTDVLSGTSFYAFTSQPSEDVLCEICHPEKCSATHTPMYVFKRIANLTAPFSLNCLIAHWRQATPQWALMGHTSNLYWRRHVSISQTPTSICPCQTCQYFQNCMQSSLSASAILVWILARPFLLKRPFCRTSMVILLQWSPGSIFWNAV